VDSGPFMSAITPIFIVLSEICALLGDTLVIAKIKATHRLVVRPSFVIEVLLLWTESTTGVALDVLERTCE
jgi:hypothetical protein